MKKFTLNVQDFLTNEINNTDIFNKKVEKYEILNFLK
jgi:hypothetical protein